MAERLAYLEAVVGADITQFRKGMRDVRNEVGILDETMEGISAIGRTMTFAVTTPLVALGSYAAQAAMEFDSSMRNINSILQLTEDQLDGLSQATLDFGSTMRAGPMEAANALYTIVGAGITDVGVAMDFLTVANQTAEAGLADTEKTTNALIASFLSFGGATLKGADALRLLEFQSDVLTQTVAVGVGSMDAFATAFGGVVPTVTAIGGSFEDTGALMAFFTQRGLSAATAGVSLNAALTALIKPSEAMKSKFVELGVASGEDLVAKFGGLEEALLAVINSTGGSSAALGELFANVRAFRAVGIMAQDVEGVARAVDEFGQSLLGATDRAHEQQMQSFAAHFDHMTAAVQGAAIAVGDQLLPVIQPFVDEITAVALHLQQTNPEVLALAVAFGGVAAAIGPVLWLFSSLLNPMALVVTGIGALATAWAADLGGMRTEVANLGSDILGDVTGLTSLVETFLDTLFPPETDIRAEITERLGLTIVRPDDFIEFEIKPGATDSMYNLWANDFADKISWSHFQEVTGWVPHVVTSEEIVSVPSYLMDGALDAMFAANTPMSYQQRWNDFMGRTMFEVPDYVLRVDTAAVETSLLDRLGMAVTGAAAKLGPVLTPILESARVWFDDHIGEGIDWISALFAGTGDGTGKSKLSLAFENILDGNFKDAINTVVPGLGTSLDAAFGSININLPDLFPKITKALGGLFSNVSQWVLTEGLPTLARMAGTLGGHLAASLYDAIAMAVSVITSPALGQIGSDVAAYGEGLMGNMQEGFNSALEGTALQTTGIPAIQGIFDQISGLADTLEFDFLVTKMTELGTSISSFFSTVGEADFSGVARIIGGIIAIGNVTLGGFYDVAATVLPITAAIIRDFINTLADATDGDGLNIPLRLAAIQDSVSNFIDGLSGMSLEGKAVKVTPAAIIVDFSDPSAISEVRALGVDSPEISNLLTAAISEMQPEARVGQVVFDISGAELSMQEMTREQWAEVQRLTSLGMSQSQAVIEIMATAGRVSITTDDSTTFDLPDNGLTVLGQSISPSGGVNVTVPVDTFNYDFSHSSVLDGSGGLGAGSEIAEQILPSQSLVTHFSEETSAALDGIRTQLLEAAAAGGATDPNILIDNFLIPLETAFVQHLGPESLAAGAFTDFATLVAGKAILIGLTMTGLGIATAVQMVSVKNAILTQKPIIETALGQLHWSVDGLKQAFNDMGAAANAAMNAAAGALGMNFGGPRAMGGAVAGGTTYLVGENGPELFTPPGNGNIISNDALYNRGGGESSSGGGTINYVTINEAMDLDSILHEMRRRGISFGGR